MFKKIARGRTDLVTEFLKQGNAATSVDDNGVSLIKWCAYYGDIAAIKALLLAGEVLESLGANFDLNGAVFHGYPELSQFLIDHGADVNFPLENTGETPLHSALCKHSNEGLEVIIDLLLKNGADPNLRTHPGIETNSFMRDCRTKQESALHRAAAFGSEQVIDSLLEAGALKELKDMNGDTPLSWASWYLRPRSILAKLCYGNYRVHPI
ncbi:MAG: ankyrin repeat domain-containing protein [Gammaproteobacteria bacterium]|nr:ankyrin repeat domain-containing protein [Gammaproteobacteria bacterium]